MGFRVRVGEEIDTIHSRPTQQPTIERSVKGSSPVESLSVLLCIQVVRNHHERVCGLQPKGVL